MAPVQNAMYERAVEMFATPDSGATVHYCFAVIQDSVKEARE